MLPNVLQPSATDHVPVLAAEVRAALDVHPGDTVVDATFGAGGHAAVLAADLGGRGKLIAIDRDPTARTYFERFSKRAGVQTRLLRGDFGVVLPQLADNGVQADAILLDLGVSSMQLDRPERGFSYSVDAPLDMRMDTSQGLSAVDVVNDWPERELVTIFRRYGEERYAKQIARAIVRRRKEARFERTGDLVDTIRSALPAALAMLRPGGRLAVISFHSLEDRIVKQFLREKERGCTCPPDFPVCVCGHEPELRAIERRPIKPGAAEIDANPRSASARLRAAVKT